MDDMMETFKQTYLEESFDGLNLMEDELLNMDIENPDLETVNAIFRAAHSIKGGSGTFGFSEISSFTHVAETLLDELREEKRDITQDIVDVLLESVDVLRSILTSLQNEEGVDEGLINDVQGKLEKFLDMKEDSNSQNNTEVEQSGPALWVIEFIPESDLMMTGNDPIRIFRELSSLGSLSAKPMLLDEEDSHEEIDPLKLYYKWRLELKSETATIDDIREVFEWVDGDGAEVLITRFNPDGSPVEASKASEKKEAVTPKKNALKKQGSGNGSGKKAQDSSIRVDLNKIDGIVDLVGELVINQSVLSQLSESITPENALEVVEKMKESISGLERHTKDIQESVMSIRMLPVSFVFNRVPRIVHDLSKRLDKNINLVMDGEGTELDKTMLESLMDPLVHIVRNSIDHGIETKDKRATSGKPSEGTVKLSAFHQGGNIIIQIMDDGAGVNVEKVRSKAIEKGVISESENLSHAEIVDLIFHPGFSTADEVSDISGRGVGMDVVRKNIKSLGGTVEVETSEGKGSVFTIKLPLTLAILEGQLARLDSQSFVIPLVSIIESIQIDQTNIKELSNDRELYRLRDDYIPIVRLKKILGMTCKGESDLSDGLLVVVEDNNKKYGVLVDDLLGQQQVVIKSLDDNFAKVPYVSGATILGDGTVSLILDINELTRPFNYTI